MPKPILCQRCHRSIKESHFLFLNIDGRRVRFGPFSRGCAAKVVAVRADRGRATYRTAYAVDPITPPADRSPPGGG